MKTTAEYRAIVDELMLHKRSAWSMFLSTGAENFRTTARTMGDAAEAIEDFLDRDNRDPRRDDHDWRDGHERQVG